MGRPGRQRIDKSAIQFQQYLGLSKAPEEILFKLNEFLYGQEFSVLRKNPRIPVNFPLTWKSGRKEKPGSSYTLSREGMFIKTPSPPRLNTEIEVRFIIPGQETEIAARGEVVARINMSQARGKGLVSGMAVVFKQINPGHQQILDRFIEDRLKKISTV
jgi:hypothetical protein